MVNRKRVGLTMSNVCGEWCRGARGLVLNVDALA